MSTNTHRMLRTFSLLLVLHSPLIAEQVVITSPTTINPGQGTIRSTSGGQDVPLEDAEIVVRGTTLTINGRFRIASLTIERNTNNQPGIVTHTAQFQYDYSGTGTDVVFGIWLIVTGDVNIRQFCKVDVSGLGFRGSQGDGAGTSFNSSGGGGGYGGAGGDSEDSSHATQLGGLGGMCYGFTLENLSHPLVFGSGGGNRWSGGNPVNDSGGSGGGVIVLDVGGTLNIDGTISAGGTPGGSGGGNNGGGGSGGSIYLNSNMLGGTSTGSISANGAGGGTQCCNGNGGGGGGGRIALHFSSMNYSGGITAFGGGGGGSRRGGAGTIYAKRLSDSQGALLIDNGNAADGETTEFYGAITLINTNTVVRNGGRIGPAHQQIDFDVTFDGDLEIAANAAIFADGRGFSGSQGPGAGQHAENFSGGGAGYGGAGGSAGAASEARQAGGLGGQCYGFDADNISTPNVLGSGGGNRWSGGNPDLNSGGAGGGLVRCRIIGALELNGEISANGIGGNAGGGFNGGGGSGGSILLETTSFNGSGTVSAMGGQGGTTCCNGSGGGGGGGRIAIHYMNSTYSGLITSKGGSGNIRGGAGTVYTHIAGASHGELVIDNDGSFGEFTEIYGTVSYDQINLTIKNGGILGPAHRQTGFDLTVSGNINIDGTGVIGAIRADGRGFAGSEGSGRGGSAEGFSAGGGGYGGQGGRGTSSTPGGMTYGSSSFPVSLGSGGGNLWSGGNPNRDTGGFGGGAIKLTVFGDVVVDGIIAVNGGNGGSSGGFNGGGGSGGSLWINCDRLSGTGVIQANGGAGGTQCCNGSGGGGGGGRIAIYSCSTSSITIQANGGTGSTAGSVGTIVVRRSTNGDMNCDCIINNFDITPFVTALTDIALYSSAYPECDFHNADINGDGAVNNFDIDPFVELLSGE